MIRTQEEAPLSLVQSLLGTMGFRARICDRVMGWGEDWVRQTEPKTTHSCALHLLRARCMRQVRLQDISYQKSGLLLFILHSIQVCLSMKTQVYGIAKLDYYLLVNKSRKLASHSIDPVPLNTLPHQKSVTEWSGAPRWGLPSPREGLFRLICSEALSSSEIP